MAADIVTITQGELTLDPEIEARCEERLQLARTHMAAGFYHWLEAGKQFAAIKQELGGERTRRWAPWLKKHEVNQATADALIRIATRFDPLISVTVTELQIDMQALLKLASPTAPVSAAEEALKEAAAGNRITKAEAQRLIAKARHEAAIEAAEEAQAKFSDELAQEAAKLTDEMREHELTVAGKDREIAELKLVAATAAQQERERQEAKLEGMVVVPQEELNDTVERLMEPMQKALERAEKARDRAIAERDKVNARLDQIHEEQAQAAKAAAAGRPNLPPLDSNLSFNALVTRQAIETCLRNIKVSPADMISIEIEFSTRLHDNPELARAKLDQVAAAIGELLPWFEKYLQLHAKEYEE